MQVTYNSIMPGLFSRIILANDKVLVITHADETKKLQLPCIPLTRAGRDILSLGSFKSNVEFLKIVGRRIKGQGVDVKLGDCAKDDEGRIRFLNLKDIE